MINKVGLVISERNHKATQRQYQLNLIFFQQADQFDLGVEGLSFAKSRSIMLFQRAQTLMPFFRVITLTFSVWLLPLIAGAQDRTVFLAELDATFSRLLQDPESYTALVAGEVGDLPESDLRPHTCVAMAWCHQIFENPQCFPEKMPLVETSLDQAIVACIRRVQSEEALLTHLDGSRKSQLAMALATYRLAGGARSDLVAFEKRLLRSLADLVAARQGAPIASNSQKTWVIDTSIAIFALNLHDRVQSSKAAQPMLEAHRKWLLEKGLDPQNGLPASALGVDGQLSPARGGDLSWLIGLWREMDPALSKQWYEAYRTAYWKKTKVAQGFREWSGDDEPQPQDLRAGPILAGIGGTGTAMGLCCSQANDDQTTTGLIIKQGNNLANSRHSRNLISLTIAKTMDVAISRCGITPTKGYVTGFLYGDALTFYAASWSDYPDRALAK
jgi:hypothetical protein